MFGVWNTHRRNNVRRPVINGISFHGVGIIGWTIGVIRDQFNTQPRPMAFRVRRDIGTMKFRSESFVYNIGWF